MAYSSTACLVVTIVLQVLVLVAIALRLYVRAGVKGNVAADDYMAVLATAFYTGLSISYIIAMANYGVADPELIVSGEQAATGLLLVLIGEIFYLVSTYLVKVSVAFTLFRIVTAKSHRYTIYILLLIGAILTIIACFWAFFLCNPVNYFWDRFRGSAGSCKSIRTLMAVHLVQASWTLISDLTLGLVIPGLVLWNSFMERRTKILVWFLLGFGSLYRRNRHGNAHSLPPLYDDNEQSGGLPHHRVVVHPRGRHWDYLFGSGDMEAVGIAVEALVDGVV
ncbi:hypothetical protein BJX65DRAFT_310201 [Aspergillus insuetus]